MNSPKTHVLPSGQHVRFGRKRSVAPRPKMGLAMFLVAAALPTPPPSCDFRSKASGPLAQMYLNDQLGDCVIACGAHLCGVMTGNAGAAPFVATKAQILAQYEAIGNYVPGDPSTDQGCNEQDALDYWGHVGLPDGTKLLGNLSVDATNKTQVMQAMWLFENLVFGIELPDAWIANGPNGSGFVWDVAGPADPSNGHCVLGVGYNAQGVIISTWGMTGVITWAAVAKYCRSAVGELHVALAAEQLAKGQTLAPNGVDWSALISYFDALGGKVPVPNPTPIPPATGGTVTLAQATEALAKIPGWAK
jgi:hypothetical protein